MDPLAYVVSITGSRVGAGVLRSSQNTPGGLRATVGRLVRIRSGEALVFGIITEMSLDTTEAARERGYIATAMIDLVGELKGGGAIFQRGVASYPTIGDPVALAGRAELQLVYQATDERCINMGQLQHDPSVGAFVKVNETLSKHFAILGATGVGKSSALTVMLQKIMELSPDLRIFLVDVHNEYGQSFGAKAQVLTPGNVRLPFWLFNFEEMVDVVFGGRPGIEEEVEILSETIPLAKAAYVQQRNAPERVAVKRTDPRTIGFTVDTPVPYRLSDLASLIDDRMGKLENRSSRLLYHRLLTRIETISADPRYAFMFENANVGGDTMVDVLGQIFRLPANGVPMTVMQLAGFPAEVVDAVVSVLCRMAFDFGLWSEAILPLLFVCEEAHRYASADRSIGFGPTRRAISRIAKEGRKYGVFLGLVTQRPAELDPTILSQCSTIFAMRMSNERDHTLLRSAIPDAGANILSFLPSLGTGEVLAFGEGVAMPIRFKVAELANGMLRKLDNVLNVRPGVGADLLAATVKRWRGATMSQKVRSDSPMTGQDGPPPSTAPSLLESERSKLLKRPLEGRAELFAPRSTDPSSAVGG